MLKVTDYTNSANPLIDHLNKKLTKGVCVSDIQDTLGRQYVDLVQEGGGVHGIALAGYTYILEKMGISFMKMAGTSAGSINTLLLNVVNTKKEAELLKLPGVYHDTRSEKVLEYLSNKDLRDFVDGPLLWRNLILNIFTPAFKQKGTKEFYKQYRNLLVADVFCLLILISSSFLLVYNVGALSAVWQWVFWLSFVGMSFLTLVLFLKVRYAGRLYKLIDKFGINPGDNFENWIKEILKENQIVSLDDLTRKFEKEKELLQPKFVPCRTDPVISAPVVLNEYKSLFHKIEDPDVKVDLLYGELCTAYYAQDKWGEIKKTAFWERVIQAFEVRFAKDPVTTMITKEIVIVSSDITHGLKVEFPGMHKMYWGDDTSISPARYVRASMSVPVFFRPMEIIFDKNQRDNIRAAWTQMLKVENKLENHALFVDGGMLSNFPINVFYNATMPVPRKPTFGIKLEYENEIESKTIRSFMEFGGCMLNTMRFFYDRDFALKQDLYKKTVRSVDTGKVHWLNFNLSDQEKLELFFRGALAATIFLSKYKCDEEEIKNLMALGNKIPIHDNDFSIYSKERPDFKTEDALVKNIGFEWQSYKVERLIDRLSKEERKGKLKVSASLGAWEKAS